MSRVHRTREQWRALIAEFEQSDLSQKDFCEPRGINPAYFSQRRLELQRDLQDSNEAFALAVPQSIKLYPNTSTSCWPDRAGIAIVGVTALGRLNWSKSSAHEDVR